MIELPTAAHIIYIPAVLIAGIAIGFRLGAGAVRRELERQARRRKR